MNHLPPQAAGDLAAKTDIVRLEDRFDRLEGRFDRLEEHFHELSGEVRGMHGVMRDQLRTYSLTTIGAMTALTGAFAAIVTIVR